MGFRNKNLITAKVTRDSEFYTKYSDIQAEVSNYCLYDKAIHLNCDDPFKSQFFKYFVDNFTSLRLSKLVSTCWDGGDSSRIPWIATVTTVPHNIDTSLDNWVCDLLSLEGNSLHTLSGNGSYDSSEVLSVTKDSDVVITNPPFPEANPYMKAMVESGTDFLVMFPLNVAGYRDVFPLFRDNRVWLGINHPKDFITPEGNCKKLGNVRWFTTLDHNNRHMSLKLSSVYDPRINVTYDNYDGIDVPRTDAIPSDWNGIMGVPLTFLDKYNPDQFELLGVDGSFSEISPMGDWLDDARKHGNPGHYSKNMRVLVMHDCNGIPKKPFKRILIRRLRK